MYVYAAEVGRIRNARKASDPMNDPTPPLSPSTNQRMYEQDNIPTRQKYNKPSHHIVTFLLTPSYRVCPTSMPGRCPPVPNFLLPTLVKPCPLHQLRKRGITTISREPILTHPRCLGWLKEARRGHEYIDGFLGAGTRGGRALRAAVRAALRMAFVLAARRLRGRRIWI